MNTTTIMTEVKNSHVKINFISVGGDVPTLERSKYKFSADSRIYDIEKKLKKLLNLNANKSLYFYCGSAFSPTPDQNIQDLYDCFQISGELVLQYGVMEVWG